MTKLEKVIDDLGRVMACGQTMLDCGTESPMVFKMIRDAANNAIVFLKAQEPRVMTATEAYTADYVYIEFDGVITPAIRTTNERDSHRESYFATQQLGGDWMRWDDYGITWRCWTSRPDEKRRAETPWN